MFGTIRLREAVTPWAHIPYEEQLAMKQKDLKESLRHMASKLKYRDPDPVSVKALQLRGC